MMRAIAACGLAVLAVSGAVTLAAHAADLSPNFPPPAVYAEPDAQFEFGTGWYLRGDLGYSDSSRVQSFGDLSTLSTSTDWTGDIGAGYRWNGWFRTDLTLGFDGYQDHSAQGVVTNQICPYQLTGLTDQATGFLDGYSWTTQNGTCSNKERNSLLKTDVLVNGYVDLGTWYGLTPYVGGGVGFARIDTWNSLSYTKNSDGSVYKVDLSPNGSYPEVWTNASGRALTPQPTVPTTGLPVAFAPQNWSKNQRRTQYNFAWALMGGVAYAVDDHLSIDLGYRYLNLGGYTDASGRSKTLDAQQVRIGIRYAVD